MCKLLILTCLLVAAAVTLLSPANADGLGDLFEGAQEVLECRTKCYNDFLSCDPLNYLQCDATYFQCWTACTYSYDDRRRLADEPVSPSAVLDFLRYGTRHSERARSAYNLVSLTSAEN
ncbi:hypothetical protein ElyMa_004440000 [Elysia marginata]|uniref:Uncharacterized protein n=1 Tax=Elysia marginata TaxID=1093978 RepID=A0AAV4HCK7_9GAST|nr:hypothetical protein ElyMa_004440000 [Elysia marginata]